MEENNIYKGLNFVNKRSPENGNFLKVLVIKRLFDYKIMKNV